MDYDTLKGRRRYHGRYRGLGMWRGRKVGRGRLFFEVFQVIKQTGDALGIADFAGSDHLPYLARV